MLSSKEMEKLEEIAKKAVLANDGEGDPDILWLVDRIRLLHTACNTGAQCNFQLRQALKAVL